MDATRRADPSDWRPLLSPTGTPLLDPAGWLGNVKPFLIESADQFRSRGPNRLTGRKYAKEFAEVIRGSASSARGLRPPTDTSPTPAHTSITTRQGKGGSVYSKVALIGVVAAAAMAFAAPAAWGDSWGADRLAQAKQEAQHAASSYPDWFERYVAAHSIREPVGDDHFRDSPGTAPVSGTSGTEADWPQIGLGLGFGVVLALGVFLAVRPTRVRPLPR